MRILGVLLPFTRVMLSVLMVCGAFLAFPGAYGVTQRYDLNYPDRTSFVAAGWNFDALTSQGEVRNTEQTSGAVVAYNQIGALRVPADTGDLWEASNNTRNSIFRALPPDWKSVRAKLNFAPTRNYQQAGLLVYQNDDNYVQITRIFENGQRISMVQEKGGLAGVVNAESVTATTNIHLRLDREFGRIFAYYSLDGTSWVMLGTVPQEITASRVALVTGVSPTGFPSADYHWVEVDREDPVILVQPGNLAFSAVAGEANAGIQKIQVLARNSGPVAFGVTSNAPWLKATPAGGIVPGEISASVDTNGLVPGVYTGSLQISVPGAVNSPLAVNVALVINPAGAVRVATWKHGRKGAFSVSVDDGRPSGFQALVDNGLQGTFVMNGVQAPDYFTSFYNVGMELGAHTVSHYCDLVDEGTLRFEIEANIDGLVATTPVTEENAISFVWPCGLTNGTMQAIAGEYFMSARGYNSNSLEDSTPSNFMNLKSFNSHEHEPFPPTDLKSIVDGAELQGKWANLVLHDFTNDDGAIAYSAKKDVWVAPIGSVVKYIKQRDRTVISDYSKTASQTVFSFARLAIPPTVKRSFETAITPEDTITFQVDVTGVPFVSGVTIDGVATPHEIRQAGGRALLQFSAPVGITKKTALIRTSDQEVPVLAATPTSLRFATVQGSNPATQQVAISTGTSTTLNWTAAVGGSGPAWLSVSPASGAGSATLTANVNATGLAPGIYNRTIVVTAAGATGSPQTIDVSLTVNPPGTQQFDFTYTNRANLLAAGWDFLARTSTGANRNTEQTSGAVISYNVNGALRIPADAGDLWETQNNTRNSLFRDLPAGWTSVRVKLAFAPVQNYQQAGLVLYQDDDNYVQVTRIFENGQRISFVREQARAAAVLNETVVTATSNLHLRLDRDAVSGVISGWYSLDGATWTTLGNISQTLNNPRLGLIVGASPGGLPPADFLWAQVTASF